MVLYNGSDRWTVPQNFKEILNGSEIFEGNVLDFRYFLIDINRYSKEALLELSNMVAAVFLLDQDIDVEEIMSRLNQLINVIGKLSENDFEIFMAWTMKILARSIPKEKQKEVKMILEKAAPKEVETLISNLERTLKKAWQDAETKGMQKGMQEGIEKAKKEVAKQMLIDGMDIAMIIKYTGLTREVIEKLGQEH